MHTYLIGNENRIRLLTGETQKLLNGPQGSVAAKTVVSVKLLHEGFSRLLQNLKSIEPDYVKNINTISISTEDVECFHSTSHKKRAVATVLEHSMDFGSTVRESTKRSHRNNSYYYHTAPSSKKSSYLDPTHSDASVSDYLTFPKMKKVKMSKENRTKMREWAREYGKPVKQRSARQETAKKKAGTLPMFMYRRPTQVQEDIELIEDEGDADEEVNEEDEVEVEQEMEYDPDESEMEMELDSNTQDDSHEPKTDDSDSSDSDSDDDESVESNLGNYAQYSGTRSKYGRTRTNPVWMNDYL